MTDPLAATSATAVGPCTQRRKVLLALPGIVLLPGIASACGMTQAPEPASTVQQTTTVPATTISAAEVPVGTAKQFKAGDENVIVAQPVEGEFKAYSARCTHQGGNVQVVEGMTLRCRCTAPSTTPRTAATPSPRPRARSTRSPSPWPEVSSPSADSPGTPGTLCVESHRAAGFPGAESDWADERLIRTGRMRPGLRLGLRPGSHRGRD